MFNFAFLLLFSDNKGISVYLDYLRLMLSNIKTYSKLLEIRIRTIASKRKKEILSYIKQMFYFESYRPKCIKSIESLPTLLKPIGSKTLIHNNLDLKGTLIEVIRI
jgi:hypothetical protein